MKLNLYIVLLTLTIFSIMSCKTNTKIQFYKFVPSIDVEICDLNELTKILTETDTKSIILKNDSVLEYYKRYGGLGSINSINYKIVNNELITDSLSHEGGDVPGVTSVHFLYSRDSLVNKKTNERYYTQKYLKKWNN